MIQSFLFFLFIFVIIGVMSFSKSKKTTEDYLLASSSVKPWLVALSAVATNNSGYMFIGLIGYTYTQGLSAIWLALGWVIGDFISSFIIHKKLREQTEKRNALSYSGLLSKWNGTDYKKLQFICGLITLVFLGVYAAAQLKAGSKALNVLFDWDYSTGAIIGSIIVLIYCYAGGIRASIWTDAAQSFVMIFSMATLFIVAVNFIGGFQELTSNIQNISPSFSSIFPSDNSLGIFFSPLLFILGWLFAGFGTIGMPHIMIRFMTMDSVSNLNRVRAYYYSWYIAFFLLAVGVGLASRIIIPDANAFDPELALPLLSIKLLPDIFVGFILAGIFAASISTADSQILSCSATLTQDLTENKSNNYLTNKVGTVIVTVIVFLITIYGGKNVFDLVLIAYSSLASCFAPLLLIYAIGKKPTEKQAITMVLTGLTTVVLWRHFGLDTYVYEIFPGMIIGYLSFFMFGCHSHENGNPN